MLLIRIILLWSVISLHVVGAAVIFQRFFSKESPWFGFFVPSFGLVIALNFIEHCFPLPSLLWLLPLTTVSFAWALFEPRNNWKVLRIPTAIFLFSFAFTLLLRSLKPDITSTRDGVTDLSIIAAYCSGQTLPPTCTWLPPFELKYYALVQYSASVITRFLDIDIGTGYNLTSALLGAFTCLVASAIAWRVSRQKLWITLITPILIECAATGSSAYLWLTSKDLDANTSAILFVGMDNKLDQNPLWNLLLPTGVYDRRELMVPGSWSWAGACHSTVGGQFLLLFSVFSVLEVVRRKNSNWPWICLILIPVVMCVTSTWGVPLAVLILLSGLGWSYRLGLYPADIRLVLTAACIASVCLLPMLTHFLSSPLMPDLELTKPEEHTQLFEFLVQWWPIYVSWILLIFTWNKLHPAIRTFHLALPILFLIVEFYTVGLRLDMTGKYWGYLYGIAWTCFFPFMARQRAPIFRIWTFLLIISSSLSLVCWTQYTLRTITWNNHDVLHIEGTGPFRWDRSKAKLLQTISGMQNKLLLTGKSAWAFCSAPPLVNFTNNKSYITWTLISDEVFCGNTHGEAYTREREVNQFYEGKCENPLLFLRSRNIEAVVIWPDDNIPNDVLIKLRYQLADYYDYKDFGQRDEANAGLFVKNAHIDSFLYPAYMFH